MSVDDGLRLIDAAPDHHWRTIIASSRFGGLRCPSEVLSLKITDVNWSAGKMLVTAPKTEHHPGKGTRPVPIFGDLRPWLEEAHQLAPDGAVYLVDERFRRGALKETGWRNCNLRTTFEKIVKRAGLTPWPRLFHNMRSSCETDLMKHHPMPTVAAWMGHSIEIATKHYCQITEADFAKAVAHRSSREPRNEPAEAVQKAVRQPAEIRRKASQLNIENAELHGITTGCDAPRNERRMGRSPANASPSNDLQRRRLLFSNTHPIATAILDRSTALPSHFAPWQRITFSQTNLVTHLLRTAIRRTRRDILISTTATTVWTSRSETEKDERRGLNVAQKFDAKPCRAAASCNKIGLMPV